MTRVLNAGAALAIAFGVALLIPALPQAFSRESFSRFTAIVVSIGGMLIAGGGATWMCARRRVRDSPMPPPVRAAVMATIVFLAFCGLEFSDGLLCQNGRVFYWTSILFLPALGLLYGLVVAHRWAWWVARIVAVLAVTWFVAFMVLIPFADLRTNGVPVPWYGRLYMTGVSLAFAGIAAYAFRSLGHAEAKKYFAPSIRANVA